MPIKYKKSGAMLGSGGSYCLNESPFGGSEIYCPDGGQLYVPGIFGEQYTEFHEKFFMLPLTRTAKRQLIGAVWSPDSGEKKGKGYGKTLMMVKESEAINRDLGASKLREFGVGEEDIEATAYVAGYGSFDEAKSIKTFPSVLLDSVAYIIESFHAEHGTVHSALRQRIAEKFEVDPGYEDEAISNELRSSLRKYRSLNLQITGKHLAKFIQKLCGADTEDLVRYIRQELGPRVKADNGYSFVHVFNVFLQLAGVEYAVYFIDQVENFSRFARRFDRDLKMLRESMCQTAPTSSMASFVFQMHVQAFESIEGWWEDIEQLPSLDPTKKRNLSRIVSLRGLTSRNAAELLASAALETQRPKGRRPTNKLHPFDGAAIEAVRLHVEGNPRDFARNLDALLSHGNAEQQPEIGEEFVRDFLESESDVFNDFDSSDDDDFSNPER